ncbi:MAG: L-2-amino-thiazoline-4-carboxylic acid hydrolase [Anaerolineae bacterium]|nr:L-2-amino-thiazoline-4-carboxylic acid hydrolase [Anaerolineae bacterium]
MSTSSGYYVARTEQLLERFEQDIQDWRQVMTVAYDADFISAVVQQARAEFEALIPHIPYIGGDENHLTGSLVRSVRCLALYKAMQAHGKTAADAGKVLYDAAVIQAARPAPPIPPSEWLSEEELMQRRRERAEESQERRYPDDFVYTFVEGDGETFDYGYNFTECASHKFCRARDAETFMPFFCFLDFPLCEGAGLGLSRTMTLADGHPLCNHRFRPGGKSALEWPPPFLQDK